MSYREPSNTETNGTGMGGSIICLDTSSSDESQHEENEESRLNKQRNLSVLRSVNRSNILSTTIQDEGEELENLGIEAYDQSTYERKVFEQVDQAISDVDAQPRDHLDQTSQQNDLIAMIQTSSRNDNEESDDRERDDERILELTRRERNRHRIKKEKIEPEEIAPTFPTKIPRFSCNRVPNIKREPDSEETVSSATESSKTITLYWTPSSSRVQDRVADREDTDDSTASEHSEYRPSSNPSETGDDIALDEDVDYETDAEPSNPDTESKRTKLRKVRKVTDDGDPNYYKRRMKDYFKSRARTRLNNIRPDGVESVQLDELIKIEGDLDVPKEIWDNLFDHQKIGVKWLWELHQLGSGGILGDEMGLGKTIQVIAFLAALRSSNVPTSHHGYQNLGPTVLVCPATVMYQWLLEFRKWWPPFRVAILHNTGTFSGDRSNLVRTINKSNGILIVSYPGVVIYQDSLHAYDWHYAILDEGHKIRNPDAQVTLACKRFRTPHRLILSGSPVQNNLKELWSIFDFIYPGKLGVLPVFMEQFAIPITQGGYANASDIQVQIAYKCACVLRDTIKPFLMRRTKVEVNDKLKLPDKSEQVLFCKLTERQYQLYDAYLKSKTVRDIRHGLLQIFVGLTQLRKICNHPDLFDRTENQKQVKNDIDFSLKDESFGSHKESGKMMVVDALLRIWKKQGHKVLLFTQSRQMLKIFMKYLDEQKYSYLSMDGQTSIGIRQSTIDKFNNTDSIFVFLLTTRVGGIGINLVGANRIIIFDPDWNPSTDIQARERAWRIGQHRKVIIYRLLTAGTIEEKIYHRQVFKMYLTNRILKDAKQKRFFKTNDLHELFTLGDTEKNIETTALFDDDLQINPDTMKKSADLVKKKNSKGDKSNRRKLDSNEPFKLSDEQVKAMKERAKQLSRMIAIQYGNERPNQAEHSNTSANPFLPTESDSSRQEALLAKKKVQKARKERVKYLIKQDIYRPGDKDRSNEKNENDQQDYILERLFKSSNVFGALKHDKIESDSAADYKVVESEAEKVARDAIRVLRESRRMCMGSLSGIPNWTGRNGGQAASTSSRYRSQPEARLVPRNRARPHLVRVGPHQDSGSNSIASSSSGTSASGGSLLSMIRKRVQNNPIELAQNTFNPPMDSDEEEAARDRFCHGKADGTGADLMADRVREFMLIRLSAGESRVPTDDLLDFFKKNFKADQSAVFKAILYKLCEFKRLGDKGFWFIKGEFRDQD